MKKIITLFFGAALLFSTSSYSDSMIGLKVGHGDLEGTNNAYAASVDSNIPSVTKSKDSMFGAIFAELGLGDTSFSAGLEYVPLEANITLDGNNSSTGVELSDYTTAYVL